jgi:PA domain
VKNGYEHRDALFGIPPYGGSIQENLYYTLDSLCEYNVNTLGGFPQEKDSSGSDIPWKSPFILMVDRGECTFVQKVRNAQRAGAAAVLIADTTCICGAQDCQMNIDQILCEAQEPIMADDGSGSDVSIPSFLVFKQDADKIKKELMNNQQVRAEMSFSVPAPDSHVEYDLWTTPSDVISKQFLQSFDVAAEALKDDAFFTPRMYIYDGARAGCKGAEGMNNCVGLCTNAGRYCATDPDGDLNAGVKGTDVVTESLRRICIWNKYGADDGVGKAWWTYVKFFIAQCDDPDQPSKYTDPTCIASAMEMAKVDQSVVDQCIVASGGLTDDTTNTELEKMVRAKDTSGAVIIPSLFVNQAPVRGAMSFGNVFRAVCAGYSSGSEPKICKSCMNCNDEQSCLTVGVCKSGYGTPNMSTSTGISTTTFIASLMGIVLLFSTTGYIVYQRQQRRMRDEVRGILAEYMPVGSYVSIDSSMFLYLIENVHK